jgi:hypothetical protein
MSQRVPNRGPRAPQESRLTAAETAYIMDVPQVEARWPTEK